MTQLILRVLNAPGLILIVILGVALQTSLTSSYPFNYLQPDIVLPAVIWCAYRRGFTEGGVLTLIFAEIAEAHSTTPEGLYLITYMAVYFMIRLIARVLLIPNLPSLVGLTLFSSIVWKLGGLLVLYMLDLAGNQWRHTLALILPGAVMEGVVGIWLYRWFERFDWITFKNPRAREILNEQYRLDEEGL